MKISANSGRRWRLAENQRAGDGILPNHSSEAPRKAFPCRQTLSPTPTAKCPWPPYLVRRGVRLIANARLEFPASHRKQSTATNSNRERMAISPSVFPRLVTRHPSLATSSPFSNRNIRFTGFESTCSKQTIKQISNRNKTRYSCPPRRNDISGVSASLAPHAFLPASLPTRLAATRRARYNSGSHIEVNQP
jgi:hypothetical protein